MSLDANDREIISGVVREACREAVEPFWERFHDLDKRMESVEKDSCAGVTAPVRQGERLGEVETGFAVLKAKLSAHAWWLCGIGGIALACAGYILRAWVKVPI